ncbi:MAG: TMEM165/GDT1 family protein [Candidatus Omnitrophota bacterium]
MDWKIFLATFGTIFLAELADKTQLVGISMAAKTSRPLVVFIASVLAYMVVTAVSVYVGFLLSKYIKPETIRYTGAFLFILIGLLILFGKI